MSNVCGLLHPTSMIQFQPSAPVADEIRALEFVIDGALNVAARQGHHHTCSVADELVQMIVRAAAGHCAAKAEGETLAPQIFTPHPLRRDDMVHARAHRETDRATSIDKAREQ